MSTRARDGIPRNVRDQEILGSTKYSFALSLAFSAFVVSHLLTDSLVDILFSSDGGGRKEKRGVVVASSSYESLLGTRE